MSKTWGFLFGCAGRGPESSCQISAYYKFFPGKSYFYRTTLSIEHSGNWKGSVQVN